MRPYILMVVVCHYPRFAPISYKYIFGVLKPLLYSVYSTKSVLYIIYIIVRYRLRARRAYYTRLLLLLLLLLLLSILSKDTGSTKGKPVRGAPWLVTYIHTQIKIQHRYRNTTQIQNNTN